MSLQLRMAGGVYRPDRDVIQLFAGIVLHTANRMAVRSWNQALAEYAHAHGLTDADVAAALKAVTRYINRAASPDLPVDNKRFAAAWEDAGFDKVNKAAQVALFFELGVGLFAAFANACGEAVALGASAPGAAAVGAAIDQVAHAMTAPSPRKRRRRASLVDEVVRDATNGTTPGLKPG